MPANNRASRDGVSLDFFAYPMTALPCVKTDTPVAKRHTIGSNEFPEFTVIQNGFHALHGLHGSHEFNELVGFNECARFDCKDFLYYPPGVGV